MYEGFARLNEILYLSKSVDSDELSREYITETFNEFYDWFFYIGIPYHITAALIDFALMRPILPSRNPNFSMEYPGWRFLNALNFVRENNIVMTHSKQSLRTFHDEISDGLSCESPSALSKSIIESIALIHESFLQSSGRYIEGVSNEEVKKVVSKQTSDMLNSFGKRLSADEPDIIFFAPGAVAETIFTEFTPPVIRLDNGGYLTFFSDGMDEERKTSHIGVNEYHSVKIGISEQLMKSNYIDCPIFYLLGATKCSIEPNCNGKFPNQDGLNVKCSFNDLFLMLFGHELSEIISIFPSS